MTQYVRIDGAAISDPAPLPNEALTVDGYRSDLPGQLAEGHINNVLLRKWGFYPAVEERPSYDPTTHDLRIKSKQKRAVDVLVTYESIARPLVTPEKVTNFQARTMLRRVKTPDDSNLFEKVNKDLKAARDAAQQLPPNHPDRIQAEDTWDAWEQSNDFYRNSTLINTLGAMYDIQPEMMNHLFREAAKIDV